MDPISKIRGASTERNSKYPNLRAPWKPGESGNPAGRPKKRPITELYEEILADPKNRARLKKQIIATITRKGMAGVLERREMKESIEGKVTQPVEISGTVNSMTDEELLQRLEKLFGLTGENAQPVDTATAESVNS